MFKGVGEVFQILLPSNSKLISQEIIPYGLDHAGYTFRIRPKPV